MIDKTCMQKEIFRCSEGDRYYQRNKHALEEALKLSECDPIMRAISEVELHPKSILEVGCSSGWRLHALGEHYQAKCFGIDPSMGAIQEGMHLFPELMLQQATADEIPYTDQMFDLVILGFCLYLCDRKDLFKISYEVDRVLMNRGKLVILDFHSPFPYRNVYSHCSGVFSYKMNYANLFTCNPAYYLIYQKMFANSPENMNIPDERVSVMMLNKDCDNAYPDFPYER